MIFYMAVFLATVIISINALNDWNNPSSSQYHIQTDEGPERYFRYQTISGQYRKEKRLEDGTVIGTYAWIDDDGILRQRDYIADNAGYRILKTKNIYVGKDTPIAQAIKSAKKVPASAGTLVKTTAVKTTNPSTNPIVEISNNAISTTASPYPKYSNEAPSGNLYLPAPESTPAVPIQAPPNPSPSTSQSPFALDPWYYSSGPEYEHSNRRTAFQNGPTYPIDSRGQSYTGNNNIGDGYNPQYDYYDGVSVTNDGFRYYIPRAYHEEQNLGHDQKSGSFGYIDPFGIRRVIYYNADANGFKHRKNNRYVGFHATPYDPRPYDN